VLTISTTATITITTYRKQWLLLVISVVCYFDFINTKFNVIEELELQFYINVHFIRKSGRWSQCFTLSKQPQTVKEPVHLYWAPNKKSSFNIIFLSFSWPSLSSPRLAVVIKLQSSTNYLLTR
jgi:hypothetical protein